MPLPLQAAVDVEFLRMEFVMDFEVTEHARHRNKCNPQPSELTPAGAPCKWAFTTQQFYFERYADDLRHPQKCCPASGATKRFLSTCTHTAALLDSSHLH